MKTRIDDMNAEMRKNLKATQAAQSDREGMFSISIPYNCTFPSHIYIYILILSLCMCLCLFVLYVWWRFYVSDGTSRPSHRGSVEEVAQHVHMYFPQGPLSLSDSLFL